MAKKKIQEINLLPQEEFEASTLGRTLKWLLTTFRYIVIGTEMIVMLAFLSRFWLDAQSSDLTDAINQKQAIISSYSTLETNFRSAQEKLSTFKNYSSSNQEISPIINLITSSIPSNITVSEINITGSKLTITSQIHDQSSTSLFLQNLQKSDLLENTGITSANTGSGQDSGIFITITADIKGRIGNGI